MRKSHFNDEFLVLLGPIISRFFACSNEEKKGARSSPISMGGTNIVDVSGASVSKNKCFRGLAPG
jgi:hypothetical protein